MCDPSVCTRVYDELCGPQAVSVGLQSKVKGLRDRVVELEREGEKVREEGEREKREAQATVLSLTSQLEAVRKEKESLCRTEGERVLQVHILLTHCSDQCQLGDTSVWFFPWL